LPPPDSGEEALQQRLAAIARRLEARAPGLDVTARSGQDLAAVRAALLDDRRHLVVRVAEQLVQHVDGALDRAEPLEQHQERERERLVGLGALGRPGHRLGHERLGQPRPDVGLAPHARRAQVVDRQARHDRRQERLRRLDLVTAPQQPQVRLLDEILCLADATDHPVGEREQQRAQVVVCHIRRGHLV
jgi:hypothetical protein